MSVTRTSTVLEFKKKERAAEVAELEEQKLSLETEVLDKEEVKAELDNEIADTGEKVRKARQKFEATQADLKRLRHLRLSISVIRRNGCRKRRHLKEQRHTGNGSCRSLRRSLSSFSLCIVLL